MRLTDRSLSQLKLLESGQQRIRGDILPGFGVTVGTKRKTFFVMFGKDRRLRTLGHYPDMSLRDARNAARDVLEEIVAPRTIATVKALSEAFLADCKVRLRPHSFRRYNGILRNAPDIPLDRATKSLAETPHHIAAYKAMFNWAIKEDIYDRNPFAQLSTKTGSRDRVLSPEEIKAIWDYDHPPYSTIVKLLLLTGQRLNQISCLEPDWIEDDLIHFPGSIMKNKANHTIPFGSFTKQFLTPPFTFGGWSKAKARMDKHTGVSGYVLHDLRRTFATIHAQLGSPIHVVEAHLDHRSGTISGVAAIYFRHNWLNEMRAAISTYEAHISKITGS